MLLPFAVVVYALLVIVGAVGGYLAVAHAMGETYTRRRLALGAMIGSPNSYRYLLVGLGALAAFWAAWSVFGWVPVAGDLIRGAAILVTWLLATAGFGAALLSRAGIRENFAGRLAAARGAHRRIPLGDSAVRRDRRQAPRLTDAHAGALMRRVLLSLLALALGASGAAAQSMRPFSTYRQWHGETRLDARLDYAAGALRLAAGRPNELYRMDVLYDGERYVPVSEFDAARGGVGARAPGVGRGRPAGRVQEPAPPDGLGDLLAQERPGARRDARRGRRRPRAGRAPPDRSQARGGREPRHRALLAAERRALPRGHAHRRRGGAVGARPGQQPLRPHHVRGRRGPGDARLRRARGPRARRSR